MKCREGVARTTLFVYYDLLFIDHFLHTFINLIFLYQIPGCHAFDCEYAYSDRYAGLKQREMKILITILGFLNGAYMLLDGRFCDTKW